MVLVATLPAIDAKVLPSASTPPVPLKAPLLKSPPAPRAEKLTCKLRAKVRFISATVTLNITCCGPPTCIRFITPVSWPLGAPGAEPA